MIGWYVHHHGSGHLRRLLAVSRHLTVPVTVFSSLPRPDDWRPAAGGGWQVLPSDVGPDPDPDPTVRGALHWAPLTVEGYRRRMGVLAGWIAQQQPAAMMIDVSAEVTALSRLLGVPTATVLMPGDRSDRAHELAYDLADLLLGLWPDGAHPVPEGLRDRVVAVGGVSRFDGCPLPTVASRPGRVLVVCGAGGDDLRPDDVAAARAATGLDWVVRGGFASASPDLWRELAEAEVVVSFAGQNAVAELAAAARPAVVVAAARPHDEQRATVRALQRLDVATAVPRWPDPPEWPGLLADARSRGGDGWSRWATGNGAHDLAAALERLAGVS